MTAGLAWGRDITARVTAGSRLRGWQMLRVCDRDRLDQVRRAQDYLWSF